jgi:glycosyl transferase family 25
MLQMNCYVINLDRAPERLARMGALLQGLGVPFERVPAVDGRALPPPPKASEVPADAHVMTAGEIALVHSHEKCWDLFEQTGESACVILEDDVHFGSGFAAFMTGTPPLPADFDLIKIETTPFKIWLDKHGAHTLTGGRKLLRLASPHMGSAGYVLSRAGLPKVRAVAGTMKYPIDVVLFGHPAKHMTIYQLSPSFVIQDNAFKNGGSNYAALAGTIDRGRKPKVKGLRKVAREIGRPFRGYWPPGPLSQKWRLSYGKVGFE